MINDKAILVGVDGSHASYKDILNKYFGLSGAKAKSIDDID